MSRPELMQRVGFGSLAVNVRGLDHKAEGIFQLLPFVLQLRGLDAVVF